MNEQESYDIVSKIGWGVLGLGSLIANCIGYSWAPELAIYIAVMWCHYLLITQFAIGIEFLYDKYFK